MVQPEASTSNSEARSRGAERVGSGVANLSPADYTLYGARLGADGMRGVSKVVDIAARTVDGALRSAMLSGFANQAAVAELASSRSERVPPFSEDEIDLLEQEEAAILHYLEGAVARRGAFEQLAGRSTSESGDPEHRERLPAHMDALEDERSASVSGDSGQTVRD